MFTTLIARVIGVSLAYAAPALAQQAKLEPCLIEAIRQTESSSEIRVMSSWDRASTSGDFSRRFTGIPDGVFCGHALSATGARFTACVDPDNPYTNNARKVIWSVILMARGDASLVDKSCGAATMPSRARPASVRSDY